MKYSFARQFEFDYSGGTSAAASSIVDSILIGSGASKPSPTSTGKSTEATNFPDFGRYDQAFAATSKIAGRINAATISNADFRDLLRERKRLVEKKLKGEITRKESNRLEYVRWTLDRIEDAREGHVLEALESSIVRYEQLAQDLSDLYANLGAKLPSKKAR